MVRLPIFFHVGIIPLLHPPDFPGGIAMHQFLSFLPAGRGLGGRNRTSALRLAEGLACRSDLNLLILAIPAFRAWSSGPRHLRFQEQD